MKRTPASPLPDGVIEHDGMLWPPKRGASATADEFMAARRLFIDLNDDSRWNPWVLEDRAAERSRAMQVVDQWKRAEPGHRTLTLKQVEAQMARREREHDRERAKQAQEREARAAEYDRERAEARLALLEHQSILEHELAAVAGYRDESSSPRMDPQRRQATITELDESIDHRCNEIQRLTALVGDPEEVVGEGGWLPPERRERMLRYYTFERQSNVRTLREEVSGLKGRLGAATDRKERAELGSQLATATRQLDELLAVPPLNAEDMCADCQTPASMHGWRMSPSGGPCPAWPGWAARLRRAREMLAAGAREAKAAQPPPPKPQPLAVIASGLPISEIAQRLQGLEKQYPDAQVRRGRANRWELWPKNPQ